MPSLTIDLDDQASDGLAELETHLEQMATTTDNLTEAQQRQLVVIHEQRAGWSQLADTSIGAMGQLGSATIGAMGRMGAAGVSAFGDIARMADTAAKAAGAIGDQETIAKRAGFFAAEKAGWKAVQIAAEAAGGTVAKAAYGAGPYVAAATIAVEGYRAILARTGLQTKELADGTKIVESNLDRVNQAANRFGGDISRDMSMAAEGLKDLLNVVVDFPDIWKEVDKIATKSAENLVGNIGLVQKGYNEATLASESWARQLMGEEASAIRRSIELRREEYAVAKAAAAQKEAEAPFQERLNQVNEEAANRAKARGEAEALASLKTVQAVDAEIKKVHERMETQKTSLRFTADEAMKSNNQLIALERQREIAEKQTAAKRSELHKKRKEEYTEEMKSVDELIARQREVYELEVKRGQARAGFQKELGSTARDQDLQTGMDAAKSQHDQDKDLATARLKATGATENQIKSELAEMDKQFTTSAHNLKMQVIAEEFKLRRDELDNERHELEMSGINGIEYQKRLSKIKSEEDKVLFDARKRAIAEQGQFERTQNTITANHRLALQQAEQERAKQAKAERDAAIQKAFPTQDVLNSVNPNDVLKQLRNDRAVKEQQAQAERDQELGQRAMAGDKNAIAKWNKNQQAAINRGKNSANRDFESGNVGENEFQQAAAEAAQANLGALQQQGRISEATAQGLGEVMNALAQQAARADALESTIGQMVAAAKGMKQGAKRAADSARSQQGSLN